MTHVNSGLVRVHDWSRVDIGLYHDFHQSWTVGIASALNGGLLRKDYSALIERSDDRCGDRDREPLAEYLADLGNRISIRKPLTEPRSVIEVVSPGQKSSRPALNRFIKRMTELLKNGVHVLVVDLFPPSPRDPQGIHKAIWDEIDPQPFELPKDKPMTLASYVAAEVKTAYVRPIGYADVLPDMPAWLDEDSYVPVPLESTYQSAWASCPQAMRDVVEHGLPPGEQTK